jgi:transposase
MRAKPWVVADGLWLRVEPLLPRRQRRFRYPGRRPLEDRLVRRTRSEAHRVTQPRGGASPGRLHHVDLLPGCIRP